MNTFKALVFADLPTCQSWLTEFEQRWNSTDPAWHYAIPGQLKDSRFYVNIIDYAVSYLTESEKAQLVNLTESDLPDPPPMP